MLLNGERLSGPNVEILVIPRTGEDGVVKDLVFKMQAVLNYKDFDSLYPVPKMPTRFERGKGTVEDPEHPVYKGALKQRGEARYNWMVITSLRATPDLVWEKVDYSKPETWHLYEDELREAGFAQSEINMIVNTVFSVNSLDDDKLKQARDRFLRGQVEKGISSSQGSEQSSTESGVLANGSV